MNINQFLWAINYFLPKKYSKNSKNPFFKLILLSFFPQTSPQPKKAELGV